MFIPDNKYFDALAKIRPLMEALNARYSEAFEAFLLEPGTETLSAVHEIEKEELFEKSTDTYGYMNTLHSISRIVSDEFKKGFPLITEGTKTVDQAIDRYHRVVFMERRSVLMEDKELLREAEEYLLSTSVSPVALDFITDNEYGTGK